MNTVLENEVIAEIIATYYSIGEPTHCQLIREGFNHNYLVETKHHKYVLRIYLNDKYYIQSANDFRFELDLLTFLLEQGISVASPIANNTRELLTSHQFANHQRYMVLFHFATGVELSQARSAGNATLEDVPQIGEVTACIHQAMDTFQSQYHRYHLNLSTYLLDKALHTLETHLKNRNIEDLSFFRPFAKQLHQQMDRLPPTQPTYGLIHGDLHGDNIFFDSEAGITIIDFDHCAYGWRIYEFATWRGNALTPFIEGYERIRPLSNQEKQLIPIVKHLRRIWDIGDILNYMPLWGETPTEDHVKNCVKQLHDLI